MTSIYQEIGGETGLIAIVDDFYKRVLSDARVAGYFRKKNTDRLKRKQVEFFAAMLGGPKEYTGLSIADAHRGRKIGREHFYRVVNHLIGALVGAGVPARTVSAIITAVAPLADHIVSDESSPSSFGARFTDSGRQGHTR